MRQVERWSVSNCRRNGVNLSISAKGATPDKTGITTLPYFAKFNNYLKHVKKT